MIKWRSATDSGEYEWYSNNFMSDENKKCPVDTERISVPDGITILPSRCFMNMCQLKSVDLPPSLMKIYCSAFFCCCSLQCVNFPECLDYISNCAFWGSQLKAVELSKSSVRIIHKGAFAQCKHLSTVTLSDDLTKLGSAVFSGCTKLRHVSLPVTAKIIGKNCFAECKDLCIYIRLS